jgi:hypothetical protein
MPRKPLTAAERKQARYWLKRLGLDPKKLGLERLLAPRGAGAPKHDDAPLLVSLELFVRATARSYGISREAALRVYVDAAWHFHKHGEFGRNAKAIVARLSRKLRPLKRRDARTLVPREWLKRDIDPEKFISFPVTGDLRKIDPEQFMPRKLAKLKRVGGSLGASQYVVIESND